MRAETGLNAEKEEMAKISNLQKKQGSLADMLVGADVFIGVSAPGTVTPGDGKDHGTQSDPVPHGQPGS